MPQGVIQDTGRDSVATLAFSVAFNEAETEYQRELNRIEQQQQQFDVDQYQQETDKLLKEYRDTVKGY